MTFLEEFNQRIEDRKKQRDFEIPTPASPRFCVNNETPKRLTLQGGNDRILILSPLERTASLGPQLFDDFDFSRLEQSNEIRICPVEPSTWLDNTFPVIFMILFLEFILSGLIRSFSPFIHNWYWKGFVPASIAIALLALVSAKVRTNLRRVLGQMVSLLIVVLLGIGLPAAIIFGFGDVGATMTTDGLLTTASHPSFKGLDNLPSEHGILYVGRTLQLIFIAIAALLPSLLYFLFDRQFLGAMRDRFEQAIFRLDPNVKTLTDVRAKYGRQIEKVYGVERLRESRVQLIPGTRMPILLTTIVMVLSWLVALQPISGTPKNPASLIDFFRPQDSVFVYGFLGAYVFTLYDLIRRYVRGDLKPKAYSSVITRIFVVSILSWVLSCMKTLPVNASMSVVAFTIGIFPESFLTYVRELSRKWLPTVDAPDPLTKIEGIDIYGRVYSTKVSPTLRAWHIMISSIS